MKGDKLLLTVFILIWVIALTHVAAEYYYLYWIFRWLDVPMHFVGGVWLGLAGLWAYYHSGYITEQRTGPLAVAFVSGLGIGFVWEVYEFAVWQLSGGLPLGYGPDTQLDLVMDVLGACVGYLAYTVFEKRQLVPMQVSSVSRA